MRDLLAGDLGADRDLPSTPTGTRADRTGRPTNGCAPGSAYGAAASAAAWERCRRELQDLAGTDVLTDVELTDVERRADELNQRAAELVESRV